MKALNTIQQIPQQIKSNIKAIRRMPQQFEMDKIVSDVFKRDKYVSSLKKASHKNRFANIQAGYSPEPRKIPFFKKVINMIKK